jgi:DnaJ-class molecular chaperone
VSAPNFYHVLGLANDADAPAIRRAHRLLARTLHPDVNKAPDAAKRFALVQTAYETLSDPASRAAYDRGLQRGEVWKPGPEDLKPHHAWVEVEREEFEEELKDIWRTFFEPRARERADHAGPESTS